ncbi:MAG: GntG family PLP-dependent aldolase [Bacteroidota bacterium]
MIVDLRSDTVTRPTLAMKAAMFEAQVGDDVFDEDPTIHALQAKVATLFGKESALYCPSGTMTNQIALRVLTQPQDQIICDKRSHIYLYEGGGPAYNSMVSMKLLDGDRGRIKADQIADAVNPDDIHFPKSTLISIENTMNKGGGCCYDLEELKAIRKEADKFGLKMHLDGARIFNALVANGTEAHAFGEIFDTISVCFSKGLGAPVGSAVLGSTENIKQARRVRKVLGGAMRQAGYLAAACIYALDHHVERLQEDHDRAKALGAMVGAQTYVEEVMPVETNIVIFKLANSITPQQMLGELEKQGILAVPFGKHEVRLVTHHDFTDDMLSYVEKSLASLSF